MDKPGEGVDGGYVLSEAEKREIEGAMVERKVIYELRGEIVSEVNEQEAYVDSIIWIWFGFAGSPADEKNFRTWLLSRIALADKLKIVRQQCGDLGVADMTKGLFDQLLWANAVRNDIAHSHISIDLDLQNPLSPIDVTRHRAVRFSRRGLSNPLVTASALTRDRDKIRSLSTHLAILQMAFNVHFATRTGDDARSVEIILVDIYRLNPDVPLPKPNG